eukprot:ANDGO_05203.mRNA.1 hypothetical protein
MESLLASSESDQLVDDRAGIHTTSSSAVVSSGLFTAVETEVEEQHQAQQHQSPPLPSSEFLLAYEWLRHYARGRVPLRALHDTGYLAPTLASRETRIPQYDRSKLVFLDESKRRAAGEPRMLPALHEEPSVNTLTSSVNPAKRQRIEELLARSCSKISSAQSPASALAPSSSTLLSVHQASFRVARRAHAAKYAAKLAKVRDRIHALSPLLFGPRISTLLAHHASISALSIDGKK